VFLGKGLGIVFEEAFERRVGKETLLITGSSRGGTSAITYALRRMGYFLGDNCNARNHADMDFLATVMGRKRLDDDDDDSGRSRVRSRSGRLRNRPLNDADLDEFRDLVARRNAAHERWGCKLAPATRMLKVLVPVLRNPACLLIYRSPYAIGLSKSRRNKNHDGSSARFLHDISRNTSQYVRATEHIAELELPSILIDFVVLQTRPEEVLAPLAERLRLDVPAGLMRSIAQDMSTPGYKELPPTPGA